MLVLLPGVSSESPINRLCQVFVTSISILFSPGFNASSNLYLNIGLCPKSSKSIPFTLTVAIS